MSQHPSMGTQKKLPVGVSVILKIVRIINSPNVKNFLMFGDISIVILATSYFRRSFLLMNLRSSKYKYKLKLKNNYL